MLQEDIILKKYNTFKSRLETYIGKEETEKLCKVLGGDQAIMKAPYATTKSTGLAYEGAYVNTTLEITTTAFKINELLPADERISDSSLVKTCLLHQIAKVIQFAPNSNTWEINNRGILYNYKDDLKGALKTGERSVYIANFCGVKISPEEYEAILYIDKEEDKQVDNYGSMLSIILKMANTLVNRCGNCKQKAV